MRRSDGIEYKPGGGLGIEAPGTDVLSFEFRPGTTSRYLFTMEVTAPHPTDHNDAFVRFPRGGFTVQKQVTQNGKTVIEKKKMNATTWLKVYNNAAKRSVGAFHVDFDRHVLVTTEVLRAGERHVVQMAGRSTRFIIHHLILFPCEGFECLPSSPVYKRATSRMISTGCL